LGNSGKHCLKHIKGSLFASGKGEEGGGRLLALVSAAVLKPANIDKIKVQKQPIRASFLVA